MKPITLDAWLAAHPYLQPVGRFCREVEAAAGGMTARASAPDWEDYAPDFPAGVPLLKSVDAEMDLDAAGRAVVDLVRRIAPRSSGRRRRARRTCPKTAPPRRVVDWLLGEETLAPAAPGLLRYLGWTAMTAYLSARRRPVRRVAGRGEMAAALLPDVRVAARDGAARRQGPGAHALLVCGCCGTRWQYSRTGCPFCEADARRLTTLAVDGEGGLRIDSCDLCQAYLKTYDGEGNEAVLLADWTSLHLDVVAHDRGLKRLAASLYELEPLLHP